MDHLAKELDAAQTRWDELHWPRPRAAFVSGSGLGVELGPVLAGPEPLDSFLPLPIRGIEGHPLEVLLLAPRPDSPVVYFRGRLHAYQGPTAATLVFPVRLASLLGARTVLLSNAAGGLRPELSPGQLVLVRDHLNLTGRNPLVGEPPPAWGPRFPDLGEAYSERLRALIQSHGRASDVALEEGVYAGLLGPSYETPAEVRMLGSLGADLVGMSTVLEIIAARHMGMECGCISLVSNLAAGISDEVLNHEEVLEAGKNAAAGLKRLLQGLFADPEFFGKPNQLV